jgi:hypothetical protein
LTVTASQSPTHNATVAAHHGAAANIVTQRNKACRVSDRPCYLRAKATI